MIPSDSADKSTVRILQRQGSITVEPDFMKSLTNTEVAIAQLEVQKLNITFPSNSETINNLIRILDNVYHNGNVMKPTDYECILVHFLTTVTTLARQYVELDAVSTLQAVITRLRNELNAVGYPMSVINDMIASTVPVPNSVSNHETSLEQEPLPDNVIMFPGSSK